MNKSPPDKFSDMLENQRRHHHHHHHHHHNHNHNHNNNIYHNNKNYNHMYCTTTTKYQNPINKKKNTKKRNWSAVFWVPQAEWTQFQLRNPFKDDF